MSPRVLGGVGVEGLSVKEDLTNDDIAPAGNVGQDPAVILGIDGAGETREK